MPMKAALGGLKFAETEEVMVSDQRIGHIGKLKRNVKADGKGAQFRFYPAEDLLWITASCLQELVDFIKEKQDGEKETSK